MGRAPSGAWVLETYSDPKILPGAISQGRHREHNVGAEMHPLCPFLVKGGKGNGL